jgi:hypothetical protein
MITISTLLFLLYSYSIYKIKKDSGSWGDFNLFNSNFFAYFMFLLGTTVIFFVILFFSFYIIENNILP